MTPAYDWTRFDALRDKLQEEYVRKVSDPPVCHPGARDVVGYRTLGRLRGKLADAREALERGRAVRMSVQQNRSRACDALTPDQFVDLWEQAYRP